MGDQLHDKMGNGEMGGKLPELANIAEEMPFELKVRSKIAFRFAASSVSSLSLASTRRD